MEALLPPKVAFVQVEQSQFDGCNGAITDVASGSAIVRCTASSIPPGELRSVRIVGDAPPASFPDSTRVVFGANVDPQKFIRETNETDNFAFLNTIVRTRADLGITTTFTKSDFGGRFDEDGGSFTLVEFRHAIRNFGPAPSRPTRIAVTGDNIFFAPGNYFFQELQELCDAGRHVDFQARVCVAGTETRGLGVSVPGLPAGGSAVVLGFGYVNKAPSQHPVTFTATLDPNGVIRGDNTGNNQARFTTTLP
jgi:hypothetical protein